MAKCNILIKLIHPQLGLCAQHVCQTRGAERIITRQWKQKYGKKFFECSVVIEGDKWLRESSRSVCHIPDGEVYDSIKSAALGQGVSPTMVSIHCNKWLKGNYTPYKFKWA